MSPRSLQKAFTLTEVLMAAGILAIGFMLIATIFPVGLKLTTMATERTIAAIVIDEALAKIRIFDPNANNLPVNRTVYFNRDTSYGYNRLYTKFSGTPAEIEAAVVDFVHLYPSTDINTDDKKYSWSALLRRTPANTVQVFIFVSRKTNTSSQYRKPETDLTDSDYGTVISTDGDWPTPVRVEVTAGSNDDILQIDDSAEFSFINKGTEILDDETGLAYTVIERTVGGKIELERDWNWRDDDDDDATSMWVVPPALGNNRSPSIIVDTSNKITF